MPECFNFLAPRDSSSSMMTPESNNNIHSYTVHVEAFQMSKGTVHSIEQYGIYIGCVCSSDNEALKEWRDEGKRKQQLKHREKMMKGKLGERTQFRLGIQVIMITEVFSKYSCEIV